MCGEQATLETLARGGLDAHVIFRHRGPLGPRLAARAGWLRDRGLLLEGDQEEVIVVKAIGSMRAG